MTVHHPGASEIGWLADLKEIAEQAGAQVFGEPIRWDVEVIKKTGSKRPDIVIRRDTDGSILASGEAKRPDTPEGLHPLVTSEVKGARDKALELGAPAFFTTNFFAAAVFDTKSHEPNKYLDSLQGGLIPIVPESLAKAPNWWVSLKIEDRNSQVVLGIRKLFERIKAAQTGHLQREIDEITLHVFSRVTDRLVQPLYETIRNDREIGKLGTHLIAHALRVHLRPQEDEQLRFLVAQGIAEVLTAILFYRNVADNFSLHELLGGTNPKIPKTFVERIRKSLKQAIATCGDYETIFDLSPIAEYVLANGGEPALQHWKDLIGFVDQLDFTTVTSDVIGSIFERLIAPERRHAMGQHYTNARLARSMSTWALRKDSDILADMACGAGTFLVELHRILTAHGRSHSQILSQLLGNDLDPFAVHLATVNLATRDIYRGANYPAIRNGDAFDLMPGIALLDVHPSSGEDVHVVWPDCLDAVVGNPPYAEKPENAVALKGRLSQLGLQSPSGLNGGNLAAWFFLLAAASIKSDGVIALVMPSGVLQNSNLESWRAWLRKRFDVTIWHCEDDVWFSDARVATCVILAVPRAESGAFGLLHFVDVRERVQGSLTSIEGIASPVAKASVRDIGSTAPGEDILVAGTCPEILRLFSSQASVLRLEEMNQVEIFSGNKLGHGFFQVRDLSPSKTGVLRNVEGLKLKFDLNRSFLAPLLSSPKDERTGEFRGSEYWVLCAPEKLPTSGQLRKYVEHGTQLHVPEAPSIEQRGQSWWSSDWRRSQIAVQIHPGFLHQVWWSDQPFVAKNNFHVLEFSSNVSQADRELLAASLASGWGALSALFISSEVGCEGVRWLSTSQLGKWPALAPSSVTADRRTEILNAYRLFRRLEAREIPSMDDTSLAAWLNLTEAVAKAAGMSDPKDAAKKCIEAARLACVRRTQRESIALAGRMRKGKGDGGNLLKHVIAQLEASPHSEGVLVKLTSGQQQLRLRPSSDLVQGAFDFGDKVAAFSGEEALIKSVGEGFECAPVVSADDPDHVSRDIEILIDSIIRGIVGERPAPEDSAFNTYMDISGDVRRASIQWLQKEVRKRLS